MTWQERQNCVEVDRSRCSLTPAHTASTGRMQRATKARTLPPRTLVNSGRNAINRPRAATITMKRIRISGVLYMGIDRILFDQERQAPIQANPRDWSK